MNLEDRERLPKLFTKYKFDIVCNLAAQAGVDILLKILRFILIQTLLVF